MDQILAYIKDIAAYVFEWIKELMKKFFPAEEGADETTATTTY